MFRFDFPLNGEGLAIGALTVSRRDGGEAKADMKSTTNYLRWATDASCMEPEAFLRTGLDRISWHESITPTKSVPAI